MKIIKVKKEPGNEDHQLKDLKEGHSMEQDFEIILENDPEQKYMGKLIITKITEEETGKRRKFAIKRLK